MDERLQRAIALVPGWPGAGLARKAMAGGITNQSYRVELDGEAFVLRVGGGSGAALGIDRCRELAALRIVEQLGVGAEVVFADPDEDVLVTRFLPGRPLRAEEAADEAVLAKVATVVRRFHDGPAFLGVFSAFVAVREYRRAALLRGPLPTEAEPALAVMAAVERCLGPDAPLRSCHNDLLAANLMIDGEVVRVIDWEYAALGDPFFDLANFASNLELSAQQAERFLELYLARPASREERARLTLHRFMSDLREAFWGVLQATLSDLDFDFHAYGVRHLQRALAYSDTPAFAAALSLSRSPLTQ